MRAVLVVGLFVFLCPALAPAQGVPPSAGAVSGAPPPSAATADTAPPASRARGGRDFTRDEFIERTKRNAEKRFDRMDANHDGILTAEERRAFRAKRQRKSNPSDKPE